MHSGYIEMYRNKWTLLDLRNSGIKSLLSLGPYGEQSHLSLYFYSLLSPLIATHILVISLY